MTYLVSDLTIDAAPVELSYADLITRIRGFLECASSDVTKLTSAWVQAQVAGLYRPDCGEDRRILEQWCAPAREYHLSGKIALSDSSPLELDSPAHRLYYDIYKKYTSVEFFDLHLAGSGKVKVSIILHDGYSEAVLKEAFVVLNETGSIIGSVSPDVLPDNGSLFVKITSIEKNATLSGARWLTRTRRDFAKTGLRVVAIRTFGNRGAVSASLQKILERLRKVDAAVAQRHVFLIYDCSPNRTAQPILTSEVNANILDIKGPNLGGGGNASLLGSLLIEACEGTTVDVEEIVICDDDAQYDAEALIRNDAFVLSRSKPCISTAIVCSQRNPDIVQESGGVWGRFFNRASLVVSLDQKDSPQVLFPYLVRATRNLSERHNWSYMGSTQDIDFSTFIFISVPFQLIRKHGGPRPFFLRNDDVELCLRARAAGAPTIVNPGIRVWHHTAHNASSEFFATLHGLIINNSNGRWFSDQICSQLARSIADLAAVGNLPLLAATETALRAYRDGPQWMRASDYPKCYLDEMGAIRKLSDQHGTQVPFEVVDVLRGRGEVQVINLLERLPRATTGAQIVFANGADGSYWSYSSSGSAAVCYQLMVSALKLFAQIAEDSQRLGAEWTKFLDQQPKTFWAERFSCGNSEFTLTQARHLDPSLPTSKEAAWSDDDCSVSAKTITLLENAFAVEVAGDTVASEHDESTSFLAVVPESFNPERYLVLNPDVREAGINPYKHYALHGRFEGRGF